VRRLLGDRDADRGVRIDAAVSCSSARAAVKSARIAASGRSGTVKRRDWASDPMSARTAAALRSCTSNSRRSKFDDTWMSMEGDAVGTTSRSS